MTEYVHLIGADDVARAGRAMAAAAEDFGRNLGYVADTLDRDRAQRAEQADIENARRVEALARFEQLVGRLEKALADAMMFLQGEDAADAPPKPE